jgi:hypothetical protein
MTAALDALPGRQQKKTGGTPVRAPPKFREETSKKAARPEARSAADSVPLRECSINTTKVVRVTPANNQGNPDKPVAHRVAGGADRIGARGRQAHAAVLGCRSLCHHGALVHG